MESQDLLDAASCKMKVVCGKQWDELEKTDEPGIRFCSKCKQAIFYTTTSAELRIAAEKKVCVYIVSGSQADQRQLIDHINFPEITREQLRKIEAKALRRLKGPTMGVPIIR
jgi:hypothetical protein